MTSPKTFEKITSDLEDMSVTLEEIKDKVPAESSVVEKVDSLRADMAKTAALIEESLEGTSADADPASVDPFRGDGSVQERRR